VRARVPDARPGFPFLSIGTSPLMLRRRWVRVALSNCACVAHYDIARGVRAVNTARFLQIAQHFDVARDTASKRMQFVAALEH
jgi:hypothetical protein